LFKEIRPGYLGLAVDKTTIKSTIHAHPEFAAFIAGMNTHFDAWRQKTAATLRQLKTGCHPKEVIAALSEDLLAHYARRPLIDQYDVYQHLLDYWAETMQDDCYLIAADGWKAETYRIIETDKKGKEKDKGWACDLVPKYLIVACFFTTEQEALDGLEIELESVSGRIAELEEEHGGEEGAFSELDKVNKASVNARVRELDGLYATDNESKDEVAVLNDWLKLSNHEAALKKKLRDAETDLDSKAYSKYTMVTMPEVQALVVDDKWLAALDSMIHGEMDRISQSLALRVKELAERYETPLPKMISHVAELESKVDDHLSRMGFSWR
jgi:type I restriction enzyme M protein